MRTDDAIDAARYRGSFSAHGPVRRPAAVERFAASHAGRSRVARFAEAAALATYAASISWAVRVVGSGAIR